MKRFLEYNMIFFKNFISCREYPIHGIGRLVIMIKKKIVIPGPVELSPEVLMEMAKPMMGHRTPDFEEILIDCWSNLKKIFQTKNDIALITGSGTAGIDGAIASTVQEGDEVINITGGKFGERLMEVSQAYGAKTTEVNVKWGTSFDIADVEKAVAESNAKIITLTHNETSTGVIHNAEEVGRVARENDMLFIMDGVTSVGGDEVLTDKWNVDICITGSQKCLAAPPGLAMVAMNNRALDTINDHPRKAYYNDLAKYKKSLGKNSTPFTPSVTLIYGLHKALEMVMEEGMDARIARHRLMARATREAMKAMNVGLFADESVASNTVSSMKIPAGLDDSRVRGVMKSEFGILMAGGQAEAKGKIFRIGHMGNMEYPDLMSTLASLELTLKKGNHDFKLGSGVTAAQEVFDGQL